MVVQDGHGDDNRLENWEYDQEECLDRVAAVDRCGFLDFERDAFDKAAEDKYG